MAPELLYTSDFGLTLCQVSKEADIYAFGMVIYEVFTGHPTKISTFLVMKGRRPRKPENAGDIGFGEGTWELVQQCWDQEREKRPTAEQVSEHFQRVAENSSIVPPGPTTSAYSDAEDLAAYLEVEDPTASVSVGASEKFSQCLLQLTRQRPNLISHEIHSPIIPPIPKERKLHLVNRARRGPYE